MFASLLALIVGLGVIALIVTVTSLWSGYVLSIMWGWFMVPVFGLPALSIPAAIGLALIVGFMTKQINSTDSPAAKSIITSGLVWPLMVLCVGYVVKSFM